MTAARASVKNAPPALRGFHDINRYWNVAEDRWVAQVLPGDFYVTKYDEVITTTLGSCVSTCVRDPDAGVAGLNHFMLPGLAGGLPNGDALRYGCFAVERLLNELIKYGARRERLEIKIFGGGKVISGVSDIGRKNIEFVHEYFETEQLPIAAEDVGGIWARKVRYAASTGSAMVQRLQTREAAELLRTERELSRSLSIAPPRGEIDLFD